MYILSLHGHEGEGAYAVTNDDGHKALYLFEQKDDATRYAGLLEANEAIPLTVVQIDDRLYHRVKFGEPHACPPQDWPHGGQS